MPNYAEIQRRFDEGDVALDEATRHGRTHRAYGWACNPPRHWSAELQDAYRKGYEADV